MSSYARWARLPLLFVAMVAGCEGKVAAPPTESDAADRLATAWCDFAFSCECEVYGYPDREFCIDSVRAEYEAVLDPGQRAGLTFAPECVQEELDIAEAAECIYDPSADEDDDAYDCRWCNIYHGDKKVGDACTVYSEWDDCDQGLYCDEGACTNPCKAAGEPCEGGTWPSGCPQGYECPLSSSVCTKIPGEGDPCEHRCEEGLFCSYADSVCIVLPSLGEACEGPCAEGLVCSFDDGCIELPVAGEPCAYLFYCANGLYCERQDDAVDPEDTVCTARKSDGEACDTWEECESNDCVDGTCSERTADVCE